MAAAVVNVAPEGNLSRYLQEIRKFPMLSPETELELSAALARQGGCQRGRRACHVAFAARSQDRDGFIAGMACQ